MIYDADAQTGSRVIGWGENNFGQATPPASLVDAVSVCAESSYSLALRADGTVIGWGSSAFDPPAVPAGLGGIASLACRGGHNLALRSNGTVVAWSAVDPDFVQMLPRNLSNIIAIAESGFFHSLALRADGTVLAWGRGNTNVPAGLSNVVAIATSQNISLALKSDGTVTAWGASGPVPAPAGLSNIVAIAGSHIDFSIALKSDGTIVTWGVSAGGFGRLPAGLTNLVAISVESLHALAIRVDGSVVAWGSNDFGESQVPARATNVVSVSAGFSHSLAVSLPTPTSWPRIKQQPVSHRTLAGQTTTFSVLADASQPLSYRWQFQGQPIPDGTNSILQLDNVQLSQTGDYAVVVSSGCLSERSAPGFLAVSNPPVAFAQTAEGIEDIDLVISLGGSDPSGLPLAARINSLPVDGRLFQFADSGRGARIDAAPAAITDPSWRVVYAPDPDGNGPAFDQVLFIVGNEIGDSAPARVSINIQAVNDPPAFLAGSDLRINEDAGLQIMNNWATAIRSGPADEASQILDFIVADDNPALFEIQPAISADGTLTFASGTNANGSAMVTVLLKDDGGTANGGQDISEPRAFVITILPVNDPPVAFSEAISLNEDTLVAITLTGFDVEGDSLSYSVGVPNHGALSGVAPNLVYRPVANYNGPDSFSFKVNDGQIDSLPAIIDITVVPVDDPPVAIARVAPARAVSPNNSNAIVVLDGSFSFDVDGDALEFEWFAADSDILLATNMVSPVEFSIGLHTIRLEVTANGKTISATTNLEVISLGTAVEELMAQIGSSILQSRNIRSLVASLKSAADSFDRGSLVSGVNQLRAFQSKVRSQVMPIDAALASDWIEAAQKLIDETEPSGNPRLSTIPDRAPGGQMRVEFAGGHGRTYVVQASTDLKTWTNIGVSREESRGTFDFVDFHASQFRFYRLMWPTLRTSIAASEISK